MSERILPETLTDIIRDFDRRLHALETSSRLARSSIRDGALTIEKADGTLISRLGKQPDNSYGLVHHHENGQILYQHSSLTGQAFPGVPLALAKNADPFISTSSTFETAYACTVDTALTTAVLVNIPVSADAGTTGEIRLRNAVVGGATSNAKAITAGFSGYIQFNWLHQQTVGSGVFAPLVEVRRTGGTGNIYVWPIGQAYQIEGSRIGATVGG